MQKMPSPLVNAVVEILSNGEATRYALEAGRFLAVCQRCVHYRVCAERPGELAARLCDAREMCERWEAWPDVL